MNLEFLLQCGSCKSILSDFTKGYSSNMSTETEEALLAYTIFMEMRRLKDNQQPNQNTTLYRAPSILDNATKLTDTSPFTITC